MARAKVRLWTKQLDEDIHDSSAAVMSFGIAFRQQYLDRGEAGKKMLEEIPNLIKRERRRDVIEKGTGSQHFVIAVRRMVLLLDEMEEALAAHAWLRGRRTALADVAFTPYLARLEHLNIAGHDRASGRKSPTGTAGARRGRASTRRSSSGKTPTTSS